MESVHPFFLFSLFFSCTREDFPRGNNGRKLLPDCATSNAHAPADRLG